jgi:hypothetical protein
MLVGIKICSNKEEHQKLQGEIAVKGRKEKENLKGKKYYFPEPSGHGTNHP